MPAKRRSIRTFLLFSLLGAISAVTLFALLWGYIESTHEVEELFDAQLAQHARVLDSVMSPALQQRLQRQETGALVVETWYDQGATLSDREYSEAGHKYEKKLFFQVWHQGVLVARSVNAPERQLADTEPGFIDLAYGDHHWRAFGLRPESSAFYYVVAERDDIRQELAEKIAIEAFFPVVFSAPLLAMLIWLIVGRGLAPLQRMAAELKARKAHDLHPLESEQAHQELQQVTVAINSLFLRLHKAFEREQRFTTNAAHELRTPLSGILLHAQSGLKQADSEAKNRALQQIERGARRSGYIIEQLLALGKLEHLGKESAAPVDLKVLCESACASFAEIAGRKQQQLGLDCPSSVLVPGVELALAMLLRNLVENALYYTPAGSRVLLRVDSLPDGEVELRVEDNGPGIPVEIRDQVFERFYRIEGDRSGDVSDKGAGLGLAIAREIAGQHGAQIRLADTPGGGLTVIVRFPAASV